MPARFRFRFDTLLRVRKRQEDLRSQALAEVRRDIHVAEAQRTEIIRQQRSMLEEAGQRSASQFDASDIHRYYQYERHLARLAVEKDAEIVELHDREEGRRVELEEAMKQRRIVERLEERQRDAYNAILLKEEQKITDETATNQAAIKRRTGRKL